MVSSKKTHRPIFSVIIPIYQVESYLTACLESVLAQTETDFEVIMINDGSQDNSDNIAATYTRVDSRFHLIHQKNRGLSGARNTGIRHAHGHYIALLDSDDVWHTTKLERHKQFHRRHPKISVSYSPSRLIDQHGQSLHLKQNPKLNNITARDILCRNPIGNGSSAVLHHRVFDDIAFQRTSNNDIEFFDESLQQSEDIECWVRIITTTNHQFSGLTPALTNYRINTLGLSANHHQQFQHWQHAIDKIQHYAPNLISRYYTQAKAYQYRYLCRWSIQQGHKASARHYAQHMLKTDWIILKQEPIRTTTTLMATVLISLLPLRFFQSLFQWVRRHSGKQWQGQSH